MSRPSDTDRSDVLYAFTDTLGLQVNLAGTGNNKRIEAARLLLLSDFVARTVLPLVLQRTGFLAEARRVRRLPATTAAAVAKVQRELSTLLEETEQMAIMPRETLRRVKTNLYWSNDPTLKINCAVDLAQIVQNAVYADIPYAELTDLALDVVADAMVIR